MRKVRHYYNQHRVSKGEKIIIDFLIDHDIIFENEKTFEFCRSPKYNKLLRFDFFVPAKNLLIEYQGHHHYKPVNKYKRAKLVHEKTLIHDQIKRDFCLKNNITLIEICYKDESNLNDILSKLLFEEG